MFTYKTLSQGFEARGLLGCRVWGARGFGGSPRHIVDLNIHKDDERPWPESSQWHVVVNALFYYALNVAASYMTECLRQCFPCPWGRFFSFEVEKPDIRNHPGPPRHLQAGKRRVYGHLCPGSHA